MEKNPSVILCGAGYRGGRNFIALAEENVHVEAFCDRDAEYIPAYYGCEVVTYDYAIEKYGSHPFIVSIDDPAANESVVQMLRSRGVDVFDSFELFYQGKNDLSVDVKRYGVRATFQVVPQLLCNTPNAVIYSFGIGFDFSFEKELAEKFEAEIYCFDPSPEVVQDMKDQQLSSNMHYFPYGLSNLDQEKIFYLPSSGQDYSEYFAPWTARRTLPLQVYRLSTLMGKLGHDHLNLLKMDIEGSEFAALPDIMESGIAIDQICIETHARIFPNSVEKVRWVKRLLNQYGYLLVSNGRQEQTYIHRHAAIQYGLLEG